MSCINDEVIQRFIDMESSVQETAFIEAHIAECSSCAERIIYRRRLSASVKDAINQIGDKSIDTPEFRVPDKPGKRRVLTPARIICMAAACMLLFFVVINPGDLLTAKKGNMVEMYLQPDVNANLPVSELPMEISIIDASGKISEFLTE